MTALWASAELSGLADNPAVPQHLMDVFVARANGHLAYLLARRDDLSTGQARVLVDRLADFGEDYADSIASMLLTSGLVALAGMPTTNLVVALRVAEHPAAEPALARELASHPNPAVRGDLAESDARLHVDVIDQLAHDPVLDVVRAVAVCQPLSPSLAEELSRHPDAEVRAGLVKNPATPVAVVLDLVTPEDPAARWDLASRTDLPHWAYERLAQDPAVRTEVAINPAVGESLMRDLASEDDRNLRRCLLRNPAIPLDLLASLAASARIGPTVVPRVAAATEAELRVLAGSTTMQVRMLVAERPDLPPDLVELFVADPDAGVAKGIVPNPAVTADQLRELVDRHGPRLYPRAARNPNCPPDLLRLMARNGEQVSTVYREIARNPNADAETLLLCLQDGHARRHVARHPNLPTATILELLEDWTVAEHAAANPSLPVRVMAELLGV